MSALEPVLDLDLFGKHSADTLSIAILREYEPPDGYWLADSFGKDSTVLLELAKRAGVRFEAHHSLTTMDPPELIQYGRRHHPETIIDKPQHSFWDHVRCLPHTRAGLPVRQSRWCCEELKERGGEGRRVLTGVRAAESVNRSRYTVVQPCRRTEAQGKVLVHPMLHWSTADVWEYIRRRNLTYCSLYDEGWKRLGCVFCPFASAAEIARSRIRWPRMFAGLLRAIAYAYPNKPSWNTRWSSPEQVMEWWLGRERVSKESDEQFAFDQFAEDETADAS